MNHSLVGKTAAANMCERINKLIRNFEKSLAPDEVAAMSLASFSNRPIIIKRLGYWNPDLIVLYGFDPNTGEALKMIQHISQFTLCLITLKRPPDDEPLPEEEEDKTDTAPSRHKNIQRLSAAQQNDKRCILFYAIGLPFMDYLNISAYIFY